MGLRVFTALFIASLLVGGCTGIEPTETVESTPIEESTETDSDKIAKEPVVSSSFANMQLNPANCQICKDEGELAVDCSTCDEQTEGFLACIISGEDEEERFEFKYSCDPIEKEFFDGKVTLTNLESETTESFQVLFNYDEEEKKYTLSMEEAPHDSIVFQCDELKEACFEMGSDDDHSNDEDEFSCAEDCDFESEIESKFWMDPQYTCALCIDDGNGNMACGCCTGDPAGGTIQCGVSLFVADHSLAIAYRCEPETRTISNVIINLDGESIDERELDLFEGDPVEDPNVCPFFGDFPEPPPAPEPPLPDPEPVPPSPPPPPDDILYDPQYTCSICREGGTNDACYCCTGNPDDDGPLNCGFTFFNDEKNNEHYIDVSYNCLSDGRKISNIVVSKDGIPLEEECKVTPEGLLFCEADGQSFLLTEGNAVEDPLICQYDGSHPEEHGEWLDLDTGVLCVGGPSDPINAECALCTGDETTHLLSCLLVEINQGSTSEIQYTFDPTTKSFLNLIITDNGVPILGNISFDPNQNSYILTEEGDPKEYVFQCGANSWETNLCVMIHQPSPPPPPPPPLPDPEPTPEEMWFDQTTCEFFKHWQGAEEVIQSTCETNPNTGDSTCFYTRSNPFHYLGITYECNTLTPGTIAGEINESGYVRDFECTYDETPHSEFDGFYSCTLLEDPSSQMPFACKDGICSPCWDCFEEEHDEGKGPPPSLGTLNLEDGQICLDFPDNDGPECTVCVRESDSAPYFCEFISIEENEVFEVHYFFNNETKEISDFEIKENGGPFPTQALFDEGKYSIQVWDETLNDFVNMMAFECLETDIICPLVP